MKKIDLHIHTKPGISDAVFNFSLDTLKNYIQSRQLDCIAITNHNFFDAEQFISIKNELDIEVLPGIEVDVEKGHILVIADYDDVQEFKNECDKLCGLINTKEDYISINQFLQIFKRINKYLVIPHYKKTPELKQEYIDGLGSLVRCGEVSSEKKFFKCIKDTDSLVPVLFSDERMEEDKTTFSLRQMYIDSDDLKISDLKTCLSDKNKITLNPKEGNELFQILDSGFCASTGLNIILGERSSGKTFTLNKIYELFGKTKYIKQFSLVEKDDKKEEEIFKSKINTKKAKIFEDYLEEFKFVVDDINKIDRNENLNQLDDYLTSLIKYATEYEKRDAFSKAKLYAENELEQKEETSIKKLIDAVITLIDNTEYKNLIIQFVTEDQLKSLLIALVEKYREIRFENHKKTLVNQIIRSAKESLTLKTSVTSPKDCSFKQIILEENKINSFIKIANALKIKKEIASESLYRFKIIARTEKLENATAVKNQYGKQASFSNAYNYYDSPYEYILKLKEIQTVPETEFYKLFIKQTFKILNEYNVDVSGGERSEFNLLIELSNARKYDMLLIDEPESSFDNLFLKSNVNEMIKEISNEIPVFVVTHNNTVGESIKPDYIIYTKREIIDSKPIYKIYGGYPSSKVLKTVDGDVIDNYAIIMNSLEGGIDTYEERNERYEILRDKK